MKSLVQLYREHQGKVSDKWGIYLAEYDRIFSSYRSQPVRILEIGIQNGGSLEIWSKYFENAEALIGCDINPECANLTYADPRINVVVGDANSTTTQAKILDLSPNFDIVIDDGSHYSSDIIKSFSKYFCQLKQGGLFLAEDLHCSYWKGYEGGLHYPYSSLAFFKRLVDVINHEHWGVEKERRQILRGFSEQYGTNFDELDLGQIHSIEFFNSVCVIRKKPAHLNVLGERFIAGQEELVVSGLHRLQGLQGQAAVQVQTDNSWSVMAQPPEEEWPLLVEARSQGESQLAALRQMLFEREQLLSERDQALSKRDQALSERDQALSGREERIASLEQMLSQREQQIAGLHHAVGEIYASNSWRITAPLRGFFSNKKKIGKLLWVLSDLRKHHSLSNLWSKSLKVLRHEGVSGLKNKAVQYWTDRHASQMERQSRTAAAAGAAVGPQVRKDFREIDISSYEVLSLDVFDTAIVRLVRDPKDVFRLVEERHGIPGFHDWRIQREKDERQRMDGVKDISLTDIYRDHPAWMTLELEAESDCCVANPEVFELYRKALLSKKKVFFVSDMYLRLEDVEKLLDKAGYVERHGVFVSSEDKLIKGDGSRFSDLAQRWGAERALHIGDNMVADYTWPRKIGIDAFHYQESDAFFLQDSLLSGLYPEIRKNPSIRVSHLLADYRYWRLGIERTSEVSIWRAVGFLFSGPLLLGFVRSLEAKLQSSMNFGGVYFLARDGDIIKQVFDRVYAGKGYETHYLFASRRCMTFPIFTLPNNEVAEEMLRLYYLCDATTDADQIMQRVGYPELHGLHDDLLKLQKSKSLNERSVKAAFTRHLPLIQQLAQQELDALYTYADEVGLFAGKALVVDVGWSGTIQDGLSLMAGHRRKHQAEIQGAYIGVSPKAKVAAHKYGYVFQPGKDALFGSMQPYFDFIELLTASTKESVKKIVIQEDGSPAPEFFESTGEERIRQQAAMEIQRGVMEYVSLSLKKPGSMQQVLDVQEFSWLCTLLRTKATGEVQVAFDSLRHARMPNGGYHNEILKFSER